ncbi:MAG: M23 family metallopeptidase [Cyanobacteria bacterium J06638_28]
MSQGSDTTYHKHLHHHTHTLSIPVSKKWLLRAGLVAVMVVSPLNAMMDDLLSPLFPETYIQVHSLATDTQPFEPLEIHAPFYYDDSPAGSYDLTLVDPLTDSDYVAVPAPWDGTIVEVATNHPGYGKAVVLELNDGTRVLMAHGAEVWIEPPDPSYGGWQSVSIPVSKGQKFMVQGSTGNSTGPHLHVEYFKPGATENSPDRAWTAPMMEEAIAFWEAGQTQLSPLATQTGALLSDEEIEKAIGAAEGTVDPNTLLPDADYQGHNDPCVILGTCPGRGVNKGYFSSDQGTTPEEANQYQLGKLREAEALLQEKSRAKFGSELSSEALINGLDLYNQAPAAALGDGGYIDQLPSANPTDEQIVQARSKSFVDPTTGQLDAPGLGGTWQGVADDQHRRQKAIDNATSQLN